MDMLSELYKAFFHKNKRGDFMKAKRKSVRIEPIYDSKAAENSAMINKAYDFAAICQRYAGKKNTCTNGKV